MLAKHEWFFWLSLAGMAGFLLIGNLMEYAELRGGMVRLLGLVGILLVIGAAILLVVARHANPKAKRNDYIWAIIPVAAVGVLLLLMVFLGGA